MTRAGQTAILGLLVVGLVCGVAISYRASRLGGWYTAQLYVPVPPEIYDDDTIPPFAIDSGVPAGYRRAFSTDLEVDEVIAFYLTEFPKASWTVLAQGVVGDNDEEPRIHCIVAQREGFKAFVRIIKRPGEEFTSVRIRIDTPLVCDERRIR